MNSKMRAAWSTAADIGYWRYATHLACKYTGRELQLNIRVAGCPLTVRAGTYDISVARANLGGEFDAVQKMLPADFDGIIVDAGGYIGTAALAFTLRWPKAQIISIEPSSSNYKLLCQNTRDHPMIHPIRAALSDETGLGILRDRGTGQWGYTTTFDDPPEAEHIDGRPKAASSKAGLEQVPFITLDYIASLFPDRDFGLVKLDIEGAEKRLFDAESKLLHRVPVVLAELHDRITPGCRQSFERVFCSRDIIPCGPEKFAAFRCA